ncbi:MAG: nucleotidyltransferase family protein, partial [Anaerotignaceae bacterium]
MNICGIIAEYNPFHNGHKLHIEESLKISGCSHVVVAMSGNFVQRGEPAIVNKWERCKMAILGGADLVIEIPTIFSTASAESFSHTAIKLLSDSGIVNFLSFGSECGDTEILLKCGKLLANEPPEFKKLLANELSKGISFPVARQKALEGILGENLDFIVS